MPMVVKKRSSVRAHKCSFFAFIFMATLATASLCFTPTATRKHSSNGHQTHSSTQEGRRAQKDTEKGLEMHPTGSSLPDCSHACEPCVPCKRVMVSIKCSVAESCPVVYRCFCRGRYYHVPS